MLRSSGILLTLVFLLASQQVFGASLNERLASRPEVARAQEQLRQALIRSTSLPPGILAVSGYAIAQDLGSASLQRSMEQWAGAGAESQRLLAAFRENNLREGTAQHAAIQYTRLAAAAAQGPGQGTLRAARQYFTDSQLIEMTLWAAYLAWHVRLIETLDAEAGSFAREPAQEARGGARVDIPGPSELALTRERLRTDPSYVRVAYRRPEVARALLQLSQALEQGPVAARRLGTLAFLAAAETNMASYTLARGMLRARVQGQALRGGLEERSLNAQEKVAVRFARTLTVDAKPADKALQTLSAGVGDRAALEVLLQTSWSNLMQRIGDALHLPLDPEEDTALRSWPGDLPRSAETPLAN